MSPDRCRQGHAEMRGDLARSAALQIGLSPSIVARQSQRSQTSVRLDALRKCVGRALIVELILVRLTILGLSFGPLAFESREMAANFIGRKHTSHFGDKRGSSLAKAGCSEAALAKFISFSPSA